MSHDVTDSTASNGVNNDPQTGKFLPGNSAAKGRRKRASERAAELRAAMLDAITPERVRAAIDALAREVDAGNVAACRELLDRAVGKPLPDDVLQRLDELEDLLTDLEDHR